MRQPVRLVRLAKIGEGVLGYLSHKEEFLCFTLERISKIVQRGTYPLRLEPNGSMALKYGHPMIEIEVPNRDQLFFHIGNSVKDTRGCVLVGMISSLEVKNGYTGASGVAYEKIYKYLSQHIREHDDAKIRITELWNSPPGIPLVNSVA